MKKYLLALPILFLAITIFSQVGEPKIEFKETDHQYGEVPEGPKVYYTFEFTNTGQAPLLLSRVEPSCGCTAADFSKEPIMPGKKGYIKTEFETDGRPGRFDKSITVYTNAPGDNMLTLYIRGEVTPKKK